MSIISTRVIQRSFFSNAVFLFPFLGNQHTEDGLWNRMNRKSLKKKKKKNTSNIQGKCNFSGSFVKWNGNGNKIQNQTCPREARKRDEKEITSRTPPFEYFKTRRKAFVR
jgi:hypothetical protein